MYNTTIATLYHIDCEKQDVDCSSQQCLPTDGHMKLLKWFACTWGSWQRCTVGLDALALHSMRINVNFLSPGKLLLSTRPQHIWGTISITSLWLQQCRAVYPSPEANTGNALPTVLSMLWPMRAKNRATEPRLKFTLHSTSHKHHHLPLNSQQVIQTSA